MGNHMTTFNLRSGIFFAVLGIALFVITLFAFGIFTSDVASGVALAMAVPAVTDMVRGSTLSEADQTVVLNRFGNRYTGDHTPDWVKEAEALGLVYPVQFKDDAEFLNRTSFKTTKDGGHSKSKACESKRTWPNGKKVRTVTEAEKVQSWKASAEAEQAQKDAEEAASLAADIEADAGLDPTES